MLALNELSQGMGPRRLNGGWFRGGPVSDLVTAEPDPICIPYARCVKFRIPWHMWYKWAPPPPGGANPVYSDFSQIFLYQNGENSSQKRGSFCGKIQGLNQ